MFGQAWAKKEALLHLALRSYVMERFQRNKGARLLGVQCSSFHALHVAREQLFYIQNWEYAMLRRNHEKVEQLKEVVRRTLQA